MLPRPLPPGFWAGVTLAALDAISPDRCNFMKAFEKEFALKSKRTSSASAAAVATAEDFSRHLGGVPAEEGCMWFCTLKANGISKLPEDFSSALSSSSSSSSSSSTASATWNFVELRKEAATFQTKFRFAPNPAFLLQGNHLTAQGLEDKECAAEAAKTNEAARALKAAASKASLR
jgi:hypothetical protein